MNIRQIIREELQKLMVEKKFDLGATMKVDRLNSNPSGVGGSERVPLRHRQIQQSTETAPERSGEVDGTLSGKEIMASTPSGYYYHGSHMPNLTKENIQLFSKASDIGNAGIGDRYGFYTTSNTGKAYTYSSAWVDGGESSVKLRKKGEAMVNKMKEKSLKSKGEILEDNVYGAPYSLIEDFAKKQGFDISDMYKLRAGDNGSWDFYAVLAAVKRGFWPTMYKVKLRPEDRFMPALDLDISHDEVVKYTKNGVVGIYNGKLGGGSEGGGRTWDKQDYLDKSTDNYYDKRDEVAILNRHAIASMDKVDDATYFKYMNKYKDKMDAEYGKSPVARDNEQKTWEFAKKLLSEYGGH